MAAPTVATNTVILAQMSSGTMIAPTLEGAATSPAGSDQGGIGFRQSSSTTGLMGARYVFGSALNFTTGSMVTFQIGYNEYDMPSGIATLANGGMRILFQSAGGWVRYNFQGSDTYAGANVVGSLGSYIGIGGSYNASGQIFFIDRAAMPDNSSGTIDWAAVTAVEVHINGVANRTYDLYMGLLGYAKPPVLTAGETSNKGTVQHFLDAYVGAAGGFQTGKPFQRPPYSFPSAITIPHACISGMNIGDGSTATNFLMRNVDLTMYTSIEAFRELNPGQLFRSYGPAYTGPVPTTRKILFNTPLSNCVALINSSAITGAKTTNGDYIVENATGSFLEVSTSQFVNARQFIARNTSADRLILNNVLSTEITTDAVFSNCSYINMQSNATGLRPVTAGDYSNIGLTFQDNNLGNEITIPDLGVNASYDFSGIRTEGQSINIHYEGAANTVTIALDKSVTATTSSAGGTVVIDQPPVTVTITALDQTTKLPIENAAVYIEAGAGGPIAQGTELLSVLTNSSGIATTSLALSANQPIQHSSVRKASAAPFYTMSPFDGTISSENGFNLIVLMSEE